MGKDRAKGELVVAPVGILEGLRRHSGLVLNFAVHQNNAHWRDR